MARNADKYARIGGWRDTCLDTTRVAQGQMWPRFSDEEWRGVKRPHQVSKGLTFTTSSGAPRSV